MKRICLFIFVALLYVGCTHNESPLSDSKNFSYKIINTGVEPIPGRLMVRLSDGVEEFPAAILSEIGAQSRRLFPYNPKVEELTRQAGLDKWYLLTFDSGENVEEVALRVAALHEVAFVEYDVQVMRDEVISAGQSRMVRDFVPVAMAQTEYPFDDPELPYQWHYMNDGSLGEKALVGADINLFPAWEYTAGNPNVIVAVIDDAVMYTHEDLAENMWVNSAEANGISGVDDDSNGYIDDIHGYNFYEGTGNLTWNKVGDIGHGTHVAGTIAAVNNNGKCVSGIAGGTGNGDGCKILSCQVFSEQNMASASVVAEAIKYAADNGAVIANNSWALPANAVLSDNRYEEVYPSYKQAIDYFESNASLEGTIDGGIVVFAAGNEGISTPAYPGAYYTTICVTAMASDYTAATYTNYGYGANICAPGGELLYGTIFGVSSTSIGEWGYEYMQGTSMATPHVAGVAALGLSYALQKGYSFTSEEFKELLLTSVHDIDRYQTGTKQSFDYTSGQYVDLPLSSYQGKLGGGYIDAHLLLMQMDDTPCLYFQAGEYALLSLDQYFGGGATSLTYVGVTMESSDMSKLGITEQPSFENGYLKIFCNKGGRARISVKAIVGGESLGGGANKGGMEIEREFEIVVRRNVAQNGGWL